MKKYDLLIIRNGFDLSFKYKTSLIINLTNVLGKSKFDKAIANGDITYIKCGE